MPGFSRDFGGLAGGFGFPHNMSEIIKNQKNNFRVGMIQKN